MYLITFSIFVLMILQAYVLPGHAGKALTIPAWLLYSLAVIPLVVIVLRLIIHRGQSSLEENSNLLFISGFLFLPIPSIFVIYFILFFILRMFPQFIHKDFIKTNWKKEYWILVVFIISATVSAILSQYKAEAFSSLIIFVLYLFILIYFSGHDKPLFQERQFPSMIAHGIILWSAFAILHYFINKDLQLSFMHSVIQTYIPRQSNYILISIFKYTSMTAWIFALGILVLVNDLLANLKKLKWYDLILSVAALVLGLTLIILSRGRAAFIILIFGFSALIIAHKKWLLSVILVVCVAMVPFIPNPKIQTTLRFITNPRHIPNMQGRFNQYQAGKELRDKYGRWWGIGLMNFTHHYQKDYPEKYKFAPVDFIHGLYISLLTETGIIGAFLFFGYLLSLLIGLFRKKFKSNRYRNLSIAFFFALLGVSSFDSILYNVQVGILFWIMVGFGFNKQYVLSDNKEVNL